VKKNRSKNKISLGYIVSPKIDFWMTGGISVVVMSILLAYIVLADHRNSLQVSTILSSALLLNVLINWPHFMGAYSLLYRQKSNIKKYKSATIYVPTVLLSIVFLSVITAEDTKWTALSVNQDIAYFIWLVAAFYLAWHYTGQAWGMIATYSKLSNLKLNGYERFIIRLGLRILLAWHVIWGAQDLPIHWFGGYLNLYINQLLYLSNLLACSAFIVSFIVWLNITKRTGVIPDSRILVSWLSIYMWYFALYFMPEAYLLVQALHALQYLPFPLRVELNKLEHINKNNKKVSLILWSAKYYITLILCGGIIFYLPEFASTTEPFTLAFLIASLVSIHHYFVDSCIWRISNSDMRKSLFSHLAFKK